MEITTQIIGQKLVVKAEGRIDAMTAADYGTTINDVLDDNNGDVNELVLDFALIDYISSIGLRVLLEFQKKMSVQGSMKLVNVVPSVMEVFTMTGFVSILTIE